MSDFLTNLVARALNRAEAVRPRIASRFEPPSLAATSPFGSAPRDAELAATDSFIETPSPQPTDARPANFLQPTADHLTRPTPTPPTPLRESSDEHHARRQPDESTTRLDEARVERSTPLIPTPSSSQTMESQPRRMKADAATSFESREEQAEARLSDSEQSRVEAVRVSESERLFDDAGLRRLEERVRRNEAAQRERQQQQTEAASIVAAAPQRNVEPRLSLAPAAQKPEALAAPAELPEPSPSINVTIGRIDVRAVMPQASVPVRAAAERPRPALSLEDYLKQREGGQR
ncbi:MAG: hypothetical protein QOF02_3335 [Blastocatellia bacterium]|jgi:hypothetical protein|nr:hypothetical protein [Blastocatellia bacterium]